MGILWSKVKVLASESLKLNTCPYPLKVSFTNSIPQFLQCLKSVSKAPYPDLLESM
jgi:hypothetical protein